LAVVFYASKCRPFSFHANLVTSPYNFFFTISNAQDEMALDSTAWKRSVQISVALNKMDSWQA